MIAARAAGTQSDRPIACRASAAPGYETSSPDHGTADRHARDQRAEARHPMLDGTAQSRPLREDAPADPLPPKVCVDPDQHQRNRAGSTLPLSQKRAQQIDLSAAPPAAFRGVRLVMTNASGRLLCSPQNGGAVSPRTEWQIVAPRYDVTSRRPLTTARYGRTCEGRFN